MLRFVLAGVIAALAGRAMAEAPLDAADYVAGTLIAFNDNGAWSWYQDERAIVDAAAGTLLIGSVSNKAGSGVKGVTPDGGDTWQWTPITLNSSVENLRPVVPRWKSDRTAVLWCRGTMRSSQDYDMKIVGVIEPRALLAGISP